MNPPSDDTNVTNNSVSDQGSYIEMRVQGPQDAQTMHQLNLQLEAMAERFTSNNKPVLLLTVLSDIPTKFNLGGFKESLKTADIVKYKRVAITGELPKTLMSIIDTVLNSFNKSFEINYFDDKNQAIAWLATYKP